MIFETPKYRQNRRDIIICVGLRERNNLPEWRIEEIKWKFTRQRKYRYYSDAFKEDPDYNKCLDIDEKYRYALGKFEEFVGRDKLENAIMEVWKRLCPDIDSILT